MELKDGSIHNLSEYGIDLTNLVLDKVNSQYATYKEWNHNANLMYRYTAKFENEQELRFNAGVSYQPQNTHMNYQKGNIDTTIVRTTQNWAPRNDTRKIIRCKAQKGSNYMKIAVTYENGQIFQHFGHTEQFKVYTVEDNAVKESHILSSNGAGHGALATLLQEENVDTLICGGIGAGAKTALAKAKIAVYGGVQGEADAAVNDFISGKLAYDPAVHCDHHDHSEGHGCGNHGCGGHGHGHMHQHGKGYGHGGSNRTV